MAKWKLVRQMFGNEEYTLTEGDIVTIGRGKTNTISLTGIVVSRDHCVISVVGGTVNITDLMSANGVFVGKRKIPRNTPYIIKDLDVIGLGWAPGTQLVNIEDSEKYIFKLICVTSLRKRSVLQNKQVLDEVEENIASLEGKSNIVSENKPGLSLKRLLDVDHRIDTNVKQEGLLCCPSVTLVEDVIYITDSESENNQPVSTNKKPKLEKVTDSINVNESITNHLVSLNENPKLASVTSKGQQHAIKKETIKVELDCLEFEEFDVKQEYLGYDEEPLQVDSDSDSESNQWLIRLSQSSPGKPFTKVVRNNKEESHNNHSYSQMEDFDDASVLDDEAEEIFEDDIITIPSLPLEYNTKLQSSPQLNSNDLQQIQSNNVTSTNSALCDQPSTVPDQIHVDLVDGLPLNDSPAVKMIDTPSAVVESPNTRKVLKTQLINPLMQVPRRKFNYVESEDKDRQKKIKSKQERINKHSSKKCEFTNSQKEERKKKLKEIASKGKKQDEPKSNNSSLGAIPSQSIVVAKSVSSNRGAFLVSHEAETKKKRSRKNHKNKDKFKEQTSKDTVQGVEMIVNRTQQLCTPSIQLISDKNTEIFHKNASKSRIGTEQSVPNEVASETLNSLKPPTERNISKVGVSTKQKKSVRFLIGGPQVRVFEIEPGNKLKKISLIKTNLVDIRQRPVFSLEKITLMKILRWNPHWLDEQMNFNEPPPILGHNNPPMSIFHSFANHNQYVQLIGDLLLMEIWECLSIAYRKIRNTNEYIQMRIESLPPVHTQERYFELFNLSVNVSLPTAAVAKKVPKVGEVILVNFGPENAKFLRFFFVHNVRCLPSPPNNINSFFSISLHATFTDKMKVLKPGEVMLGRTLTDIKQQLILFESIEYLAGSPLSEAILKPEPHHFPKIKNIPNIQSQWTSMLNPSQQLAVSSSVSAALSDRPCVQMVQGPPGTGKSSVICAIVMTYFYDALDKKQQNRGKILICATSNAAVDELVIRLLNIRQRLPKAERFRMVRVGRAEAMHPRARDVSSQNLAQRDLAQPSAAHPAHASIAGEISRLEAKINMWKAAAQDAKDPVRVAYCQGRITDIVKKIALVRGGSGARPEQLAELERCIVEGADIIITTLASTHNYKMQGLKRRIALCIVDEAGQAIEPETLLPLTLDVTRLTLIGDPQQLPGYICSQRAKKHGLGESLFSRLASCGEQWAAGSPAVLLDRQYRMQPAIADYPNRAFYDGRVSSAPPPRPALPIPPYTILTIASGDRGQSAGGVNETEAWGVARLAAALEGRLRPLSLSLAVITPYHAQKDHLKKCLRMLYCPNMAERAESAEGAAPVEVNTVDSFQGQERDVVVVSLARSQGVGFLTDVGRMNVMLTRARHALVVCLNPHAMMKNPQWRTLVEDAQRRQVYKVLPSWMCQPIAAGQMANDEILDCIIDNKLPCRPTRRS